MAPPRRTRPDARRHPPKILGLTLEEARARTRQFPRQPLGWQSLAAHLAESGNLAEAEKALARALENDPDNAQTLRILADLASKKGDDIGARQYLERALALEPEHIGANIKLAELLHLAGSHEDALQYLDRVPADGSHRVTLLALRGLVMLAQGRPVEAEQLFSALTAAEPNNFSHWNNLGNAKRELGKLEEADACYLKAASLTRVNPQPLANRLTNLHYMPAATQEAIFEACTQWGALFQPEQRPVRPEPRDKSPGRTLRLGMISDGFRAHPVGSMTTTALERLARLGFEIYAYSSSKIVDHITQRLMSIATSWTSIHHLGDEALAQKIRDDGIDILIDLSGFNAGSRMRVMAMEPAPILVKWVGGLINTTGVAAIDYLITDAIESPPGTDQLYTEKLIRMPDDYICFVPPLRAPAVQPPPLSRNGYVTFGCFNNPTKVNEPLLKEWAKLLHAVPGSKLFLKGVAFGHESGRERVLRILAESGIARERVRLEGKSPHSQLLAAYNEVDIALDPWPYSGGLTTCEAMYMGVPVITRPGPTFAGRHSATHLINAGMPELVAKDWDDYRRLAIDLASDVASLTTIRRHLRDILLQSPVCDAARFSRNLAHALRAIWQRYCAGKPPASLRFVDGHPQFEDDDAPTLLAAPSPDKDSFSFSFQGKVVALDHGCTLIDNSALQAISDVNALELVCLDPAGCLGQSGKQYPKQCIASYHSHIALGDGQPATLYACIDGTASGTLQPHTSAYLLPVIRLSMQVIARLPIPTVRLDDIKGLSTLDWLALGPAHDNQEILLGGKRLLQQALVIHVRVPLVETYENQSDLSAVIRLLAGHGFRLLHLTNPAYRSYFTEKDSSNPSSGSQQISIDAVFIPEEARLQALGPNPLKKLAFILHTAYGAHDAAYHALQQLGDDTAERYLESLNASKPNPVAALQPESSSAMLRTHPQNRKIVHVCFNNMHVQSFIQLVAGESFSDGILHQVLIEKTRSVSGYDIPTGNSADVRYFDKETQLQAVTDFLLQPDVEAIFIHGLFFDWQKQLIRAVGPTKKIIWVIWGGDLYNPIARRQPLREVVRHISAVATGVDGDYRLFEQVYGARPRLQFAYPTQTEFQFIEQPKEKSRLIFVGNSGDRSNGHLEILASLSRKSDIGSYDIVLPVAYNLAPAYEEELRNHIRVLGLSKRTQLLTKLMPQDQYFAWLATAEILVTAHHRQQGMFNLMAALYFGCKTILRKDIQVGDVRMRNPSWEVLTEKMNAQVTDFDDFVKLEKLSDLPALSASAWQRQREGVLRFNRRSDLQAMLREQFARARDLRAGTPVIEPVASRIDGD